MSWYKPNQYQPSFVQGNFTPPAPQRQTGFDWSYGRRNYDSYSNNQNPAGNQQRVDPLPGKLIFDLNDIKPNDIPGNGQVAWFPAADYSCIIAKGWSTEGDRIETRKYIPEEIQPAQDKPSLESILMGMAQKLNQMEQLLISNGFTLPEDTTQPNNQSQNKEETK